LLRLLVREQLVSVTAGVAIGAIISVWAVRFVRGYLYEITPYDPRVWAAAIAVIVLTALAGTVIPSWRASRTDPVVALRVE
jgi:ABC-type antimicrobial peptide transport system permease subunit